MIFHLYLKKRWNVEPMLHHWSTPSIKNEENTACPITIGKTTESTKDHLNAMIYERIVWAQPPWLEKLTK